MHSPVRSFAPHHKHTALFHQALSLVKSWQHWHVSWIQMGQGALRTKTWERMISSGLYAMHSFTSSVSRAHLQFQSSHRQACNCLPPILSIDLVCHVEQGLTRRQERVKTETVWTKEEFNVWAGECDPRSDTSKWPPGPFVLANLKSGLFTNGTGPFVEYNKGARFHKWDRPVCFAIVPYKQGFWRIFANGTVPFVFVYRLWTRKHRP